jgi:hypothetical protein
MPLYTRRSSPTASWCTAIVLCRYVYRPLHLCRNLAPANRKHHQLAMSYASKLGILAQRVREGVRLLQGFLAVRDMRSGCLQLHHSFLRVTLRAHFAFVRSLCFANPEPTLAASSTRASFSTAPKQGSISF